MQNMIYESGVKFQTSGGLSMTCGDKHYWTWAGDPNYPLPEGYPCACGLMLWHREKCKECGNDIIKPITR